MAVDKGWDLPESWSGYSQHSYDCRPLPTERVSAATVLRFRDEVFDRFIRSKRYLDMAMQKFGWETRHQIEQMTSHRLRRHLREDMTDDVKVLRKTT